VSEFLGIAREPLYSPGKIVADRAILEAVATGLRTHHHRVRVLSADEALPTVSPGTTVFTMCQGPKALQVLRHWQRLGVRVVNTPEAIENCHRHRMVAAFERDGVRHPPSTLVDTNRPDDLPGWTAEGAWLKRSDVHATEPGDVSRVDGTSAARIGLRRLAGRGIDRALVQHHVEGQVFKFYAVSGLFFAALPVAGGVPELPETERKAMTALAERGAAALGLEIFGGDCVRDRLGGLWLIDLNDWPSYAPCRTSAAEAISTYLDTQSEQTTS
jgi:hypothetical protein